ncbi:NAD-dependent epimerase/dehydratase family protein (plasmid) [Paracoccus liaowanqingii]|uniref:NAD-dependent epimerase/dehydratase family protein n=1 Tax=Paracoccus liaowanqingii TaxID=2560053 RepID=A0A4Y5SU66_9RHOB|nr:NAD-dependent epimerase/dehydratase family protein [Paracoccus liaowanqingii]QDA36325.1 NAD-dependent epimerase/dehydratase family protein [Paracoccus liaowanqingii]
MRICVTGAIGFVGSAIVFELLGAGHHVIGPARTDAAVAALRDSGAVAQQGALDGPDRLRRGVELADGVIHAAFDHDSSRFGESCEADLWTIEVIGQVMARSGQADDHAAASSRTRTSHRPRGKARLGCRNGRDPVRHAHGWDRPIGAGWRPLRGT